jgi:DNA-binding CsgD family transcriptional regulator/DNA-binding Xre family transcriptional regulator
MGGNLNKKLDLRYQALYQASLCEELGSETVVVGTLEPEVKDLLETASKKVIRTNDLEKICKFEDANPTVLLQAANHHEVLLENSLKHLLYFVNKETRNKLLTIPAEINRGARAHSELAHILEVEEENILLYLQLTGITIQPQTLKSGEKYISAIKQFVDRGETNAEVIGTELGLAASTTYIYANHAGIRLTRSNRRVNTGRLRKTKSERVDAIKQAYDRGERSAKVIGTEIGLAASTTYTYANEAGIRLTNRKYPRDFRQQQANAIREAIADGATNARETSILSGVSIRSLHGSIQGTDIRIPGLRYKRRKGEDPEEKKREIQEFIDSGIDTLEELCDITGCSPGNIARRGIKLPETMKPWGTKPEYDQLILEGRTLEYIGNRVGKTRELVRHYVKSHGFYPTWKKLRSEVKLTSKTARADRIDIVNTLSDQVFARYMQLAMKRGPAHFLAAQYFQRHRRSKLEYDAVTTLFIRVTSALKSGEKLSYMQLSEGLNISFGQAGRILNESKIPSLTGNTSQHLKNLTFLEELVEEGITDLNLLSQKIGVAPAATRQYLCEIGVKLPKQSYSKMEPEVLLSRVRELAHAGQNGVDIAVELNQRYETICNVAKVENITLAKTEGRKGRANQKIAAIKDYVKNGLVEPKEIGEKLGIAERTVIAYAYRGGLSVSNLGISLDRRVYAPRLPANQRIQQIMSLYKNGQTDSDKIAMELDIKPSTVKKYITKIKKDEKE